MRWLKGSLSDFRACRSGRAPVQGGFWGSARWSVASLGFQPLTMGMDREVDVYVAAITSEHPERSARALIDGIWQPLSASTSTITIGEEVVEAEPRRAIVHQTRVYAQGSGTLVIPVDPRDELLQWDELITYRGLCFMERLLGGLGVVRLAREGMQHPVVLLPEQPGPSATWLPSRVASQTVGYGQPLPEKPLMHFVFWSERPTVASRRPKGAMVYAPVPPLQTHGMWSHEGREAGRCAG